MADYIDAKYCSMLSVYVRNFKKVSTTVWNFSCPFCGDSARVKTKARGYLHKARSSIKYTCHNCNIPGKYLSHVLEECAPHLHTEYKLERLKDSQSERGKSVHVKEPRKFGVSKSNKLIASGATPINTLESSSVGRKFVAKRQIDVKYWSDLYLSLIHI